MKAPGQRQLEWSGRGPTQSLHIGLKSWNYSVEVGRLGGIRRHLQFEGVVSTVATGGLGGLPVCGSIDTNWLKEELPSDPAERDAAIEKATLGSLSLMEEANDPPSFGVTLSLPEESWGELLRPFFVGPGKDNLSLNLRIAHPRGSSATFWKTAWRREQLNVTDLTASASSPPALEQRVGAGALIITRKLIAPALWGVVIVLAVSRACDWLRS